MASGWNLWVWLVSVVVRRYIIDILTIIITFPYSTSCISSFFGSIIPISLFIFKCFFVLVYYYIAYERLTFWALDEHYNYCLRAALLLGSGLVLYSLRASSFIVSE